MICRAIFAVAAVFVAVESFTLQRNDAPSEFRLTSVLNNLYQLVDNDETAGNQELIESLLTELATAFPDPDKALLQLKNLVDTSIENATTKLKDLTNDLAKRAQSTVVQSNKTLLQEADSLLDEVSVLERECEALGINATHCTEGRNPSIRDLPSLFSGKLDECKEGKVSQGAGLIQSAQNSLKNAYTTVQQFTDDLSLCDKQSGVRVKLCRARVGLNIVNATETLPVDISKVVADSIQLINSVFSEVQICTVTVNTDFLNQGKQIIDNIERCIDGEIHFDQ